MTEIREYAQPILEKWGRPRIEVDRRDLTWADNSRGHSVPTLLGPVSRIRHYSYGAFSFTIQGFDVNTERPGEGRWPMLYRGAPVLAQIVDDGDDRPEDLEVLTRGNIDAFRPTLGGGLEVVCVGRFLTINGQVVPPSLGVVPRTLVEDHCKNLIDQVIGRAFRPLRIELDEPTGIYVSARGDYSSPLAMIDDALAQAPGYTIRFDDEAAPRFVKDTPRNTWTMTFGQPGLEVDLLEDHAQAIGAVYGYGVNERGGAWRNEKYPAADLSETPAYPAAQATYAPGATLPTAVGKTFWRLMREAGYKITSTATRYDAADKGDVVDMQQAAGVETDGVIGPQTWAALVAPGLGSDLGHGFILPLAMRDDYLPYRYSATGKKIGVNKKYDPRATKNSIFVTFGDGLSKKDGSRSSRQILRHEGDAPISGTLTLTADPQEGFRLQIREGDKFILRSWMGRDLVLWVSEASLDPGGLTATLTVSTRKASYSTTAQEIAQERGETASRREANGRTVKQPGIIWDVESPAGHVSLTSHAPLLGSLTYVPMPHHASVVSTRLKCSTKSELIYAFFKKPVDVKSVETAIGGNPFSFAADSDQASDPTAGRHAELRDLGLVTWVGSRDQPGGYSTEQKPDDVAKAAALLDGTYRDDASWEVTLPDDNPGYLFMVSWVKDGGDLEGDLLPASEAA